MQGNRRDSSLWFWILDQIYLRIKTTLLKNVCKILDRFTGEYCNISLKILIILYMQCFIFKYLIKSPEWNIEAKELTDDHEQSYFHQWRFLSSQKSVDWYRTKRGNSTIMRCFFGKAAIIIYLPPLFNFIILLVIKIY